MTKAEQATALRRDTIGQIEAIQRDRDLTPQAKAERIGRIRKQTNDQLQKLRVANAQETQKHINSYYQDIFGFGRVPAGASTADRQVMITSLRDAIFRMDAIENPDDAARILSRAQMLGDVLLQKAVGLRAYERGWPKVLDDFATLSSDTAAFLDELRTLERSAVSGQTQLGLAFTGIPETSEERSARATTMQAGA